MSFIPADSSVRHNIHFGMGAIPYVSPTGSGEALGTAPNSAWQTLAKLNEQTFAPGDQILFERGGIG